MLEVSIIPIPINISENAQKNGFGMKSLSFLKMAVQVTKICSNVAQNNSFGLGLKICSEVFFREP